MVSEEVNESVNTKVKNKKPKTQNPEYTEGIFARYCIYTVTKFTVCRPKWCLICPLQTVGKYHLKQWQLVNRGR